MFQFVKLPKQLSQESWNLITAIRKPDSRLVFSFWKVWWTSTLFRMLLIAYSRQHTWEEPITGGIDLALVTTVEAGAVFHVEKIAIWCKTSLACWVQTTWRRSRGGTSTSSRSTPYTPQWAMPKSRIILPSLTQGLFSQRRIPMDPHLWFSFVPKKLSGRKVITLGLIKIAAKVLLG